MTPADYPTSNFPSPEPKKVGYREVWQAAKVAWMRFCYPDGVPVFQRCQVLTGIYKGMKGKVLDFSPHTDWYKIELNDNRGVIYKRERDLYIKVYSPSPTAYLFYRMQKQIKAWLRRG